MLESWVQLSQKLNEDAIKNKVPISGQFELTARCNLNCKMCYVCQPANDKGVISRELSLKEWIWIAEEAKRSGMLYLLLTGGEVFLRNDFRELYEAFSTMGFYIKIYTNGTLITPQTAKWLGRIPPRSMEITLYGASAETYYKVTGNANAFNHAISGLDLILSEGIKVQLRTTVIYDNAGDYEKLFGIAQEKGLLLRFVLHISDRRGDEKNRLLEKIRLSPYEIAQYEMRAGKDYAKSVKSNSVNENIIRVDDPGKMLLDYESPLKCLAGKSEFWITWDGKMSACAMIDDLTVNPLELGFSDAWKELRNICKSIPSCIECRDCSLLDYCWTCPARLKLETGSYEKPSTYFCEWAKYRNMYFSESG